MVLKSEEDDRYLVLWVESPEANAIAAPLMGNEPQRPTSHDLLRHIISDMDGRLAHIVINDLAGDVMRCRIVIETPGKSLDFDARPSDAVALAVRGNVPILVEDSVMDEAGVVLNEEITPQRPPAREHRGEPLSPVNPLELEGMSAFKEFIQSLNLDDLDGPEMPPV